MVNHGKERRIFQKFNICHSTKRIVLLCNPNNIKTVCNGILLHIILYYFLPACNCNYFKNISFFSRSHFHEYTDWLHFSKYNIYNSRNNQISKAKRTQNTLSLILLIFIFLDLSFLAMAHFV